MNIPRTRICFRIDTDDNFENTNPILLNGEFVIVQCKNYIKLKVGDGEHHFNELDYIVDPELVNLMLERQRELESRIIDSEFKTPNLDTMLVENKIEMLKKQFDRLTGWYLFTTIATFILITIFHI